MKLRVERDVLAEAVAWTARSLPVRPPVPVLAGVRLEATSDGTLTLSTFDDDVSARSPLWPTNAVTPWGVSASGRVRMIHPMTHREPDLSA